MQIANCTKMGGCCRPQPAVSPLWEAEPVPLSSFNSLALCRGWWQHLSLLLSPYFFWAFATPAILAGYQALRIHPSLPLSPPAPYRCTLPCSPLMWELGIQSQDLRLPQACTVNSVNTVHLPRPQNILLSSLHLFGLCLITPIQPFEVHWSDLGLQHRPIGGRVLMKKAWMVSTTHWLWGLPLFLSQYYLAYSCTLCVPFYMMGFNKKSSWFFFCK